jgi:large subunit ribosomal protein L15
MKPGFEGGQLPIIKRLPKTRGFTNIFKTEFALANLTDLARFEAGTTITAEELVKAGVLKNTQKPLKILGNGEISRALTVKASKFSASARTKIEAAGGKAEEVS